MSAGRAGADVFGRAAATYDTVVPFFASFGARLADLADLRPGERVLDVGCGRGAALVPAAAQLAGTGSIVGADLSIDMVRLLAADLRRDRVPRAAVALMDGERLAVADGAFDVVLAAFLLHLVPEPDRCAAALHRAARPGGRCVGAVPSGGGRGWEFLLRVMGQAVGRAVRPPDLPFRQSFDLAGVLAGAGFEVVAEAREEIEFVFADEAAWWKWAWSHGMRAFFEVLPPDALEELRQGAFAELATLRTEAGIPMPQPAQFVVARR